MGMYTGLRFKVTVKPEYRDYIKEVSEGYEWFHTDKLPIIDKWMKFYRHNFIPFGELCYMPDSWDKEWNETWSSVFNEKTGEWKVICSLKNYEDEIEWFLDNVLSKIIESQEYVESLYELNDEPMIHVLSIEGN